MDIWEKEKYILKYYGLPPENHSSVQYDNNIFYIIKKNETIFFVKINKNI